MMATKNGTHQFSDSHFEKKLSHLKDTQESIQGLSAWCLAHKSAFLHIIKCWLKAVRKAKVDQRLTLFHLANDVVQHSKKKGCPEIVSAWEPALLEATPFVSGEDNVRQRVQRIFKIWEEREVYPSAFIAKLNKQLDPANQVKEAPPPPPPPVKVAADFETAQLIEKIRQCKNLEEETDRRQRLLNESKVKITEVEKLRANVKERRKTDDFFSELNDSVTRMEDYVKSLETETRERTSLIALLQQGDLFYETQRGEFKVVCLAYKQFGSRVKGVKRKLEETVPNNHLQKCIKRERCPSPPLPSADAPSPGSSNGSDLELPDAFNQPPAIGNDWTRSLASSGMDLDSRITSFLAAGSHPELGSFLSSPEAKKSSSPAPAAPPPPPPPLVDAFPFYPGVNSPFGDLTSLLVAPPPPPPPPPPPLLPPPVFQDLPKPEPPPPPPVALLGHHPARNGAGNSFHSSGYNNFAAEDVDLRGNKRPVDHRNLISLTGGPDQTKSVLGVDEMQISNWLKDARSNSSIEKADINEKVNSLLDSFTGPSQQQPQIKSLTDPNLLMGAGPHQSFQQQQQQHGPSMVDKVPSLMSTVLYPTQRPPHHLLRGAVGPPNNMGPFNSPPATRFQNSPSQHHQQRFSRPPYPRW